MPHTPYQQIPPETPKPKNYPLIILSIIGAIVLILVIIFIVIPYFSDGKRGDNNLNVNNSDAGSLVNNTSQFDCSSDVYNCGNFTTQTEAQVVFDYCNEQDVGDVHQLDNDGDGRVCEGLPLL